VQRRSAARKRTSTTNSSIDNNLRKNLIIDNVQRTNDVSVTSEMNPLRPLMNSLSGTEQRPATAAGHGDEIQASSQRRLHFTEVRCYPSAYLETAWCPGHGV